MARTSFKQHNCSVARSADLLGDPWVLLILRDSFYGSTTFSEFQNSLKVSRTVLSDRLERLVTACVLEKRPTRPGVERYTYHRTARADELFPLLVTLMQWGDRWLSGPEGQPVKIVDAASCAPVQEMVVMARDGRHLRPQDSRLIPGPGAGPGLLKALAHVERKRRAAAE